MPIKWLAKLWAVNDNLPAEADLVVPVAHGATKTHPTLSAYAATNQTRRLLGKYPLAICRFGTFTASPNPAAELYLKEKLPRSGYVGNVMTTIEECVKIKNSLSFIPTTIIVVTDEAHSRRCRIVWRTFFPQSDIRICSVPLGLTIDWESPMRSYRHAWTALLFQAAPTPFFWYLAWRGPEYMARWATKIHQPVAK